ncbi:MAG: NUDIX domain-containing protein [Alphaproteobacteria bacterium]|nr:NUDIX domain-containing protein [Alphaproteobacteria bacterium]
MIKLYWKIKNSIYALFSKRTMGARALVLRDNRILLVKHTYMPGWCTIGGGIESGETGLQALRRELQEEVGITLRELPSILGFYYNRTQKRDDYVITYICKEFEKQDVVSIEILEEKWFSLDALPSDISPGTKRRIEEYLGHRSLSDKW